MPPTRLFISHSSDDTPLAEAIAQRLAARPGVQVLLDSSGLDPGRPWRSDLHLWLARCDACLLLMTEAVRARPKWVLKEAIILGFRKEQEGAAFGFHWALGPGVQRAQFIAQGFDLAQLGDVQRLATCARLEDADALVDELLAQLPAPRGQTPHDRLVAALAELLSLRRCEPETTCPKIAAHLGLEVPPNWGPDRIRLLAEGVAEQVFRSRAQGLAIDTLMGQLALWESRDRLAFAELLAPHWVDLQPAAMLRGLMPTAPGAPPPAAAALAIRGQHVAQYTARMYLLRAYGQQATLLADAVGGSSPNHYQDIRDEVCAFAKDRRLVIGKLTPEKIVAQLSTWPDPIYVPLTELPDDDTLRRLRAEFPRVMFIVADTGHDASLIVDLPPPPPPDIEAQECQAWRSALKYF